MLGLVALATMDGGLLRLANLHSTLERDEPTITLSVVGSLQGVLLAVDPEDDLVWVVLLQVGGIVERKNAVWASALSLTLLVEEKETLAGLAGPGNDWVGNLSLLATGEEVEVLGCDRRIAQPEFLLGWHQRPA